MILKTLITFLLFSGAFLMAMLIIRYVNRPNPPPAVLLSFIERLFIASAITSCFIGFIYCFAEGG